MRILYQGECLVRIHAFESFIRTLLQPSGSPPMPRTDHTFIRYENKFIVFAGRDDSMIFKDLHIYDIGNN